MLQQVRIRKPSLLGGTNFGALPISVRENELAFALNFKPTPPRIRSRGGTRQMAQVGLADVVQVLGFQSSEKSGQWAGMVWGSHGVSYVTGSPLGNVPIAALAANNFNEAWVVAEAQRTLFAARPTNGLLMARLDPAPVVALAGIDPPTFTAVAAAGAAGVLTAANYQYVFTYYDSLSGAESSYGPVSNTLALGANLQINLTGLVASTSARVNSIRIYRTFPNGTGAWYLVATIPHTQTTYADNIPVTSQGKAAEANNGLPPSGIISVQYWNGRLWITDGKFLYPSKLLNFEAFDPLDALAVGSPADSITGLLATDDALVVGRRQGMSYVTGTGRTTWAVKEADKTNGLVGPYALARVGTDVYWLSDSGLFRGTGTSEGVPVSGDRLRPWFSTQFGFGSLASATQSRTWALGSVPTSDGLILSTHVQGGMFFYHIPTNSFWPWRLQNAAGSGAQQYFFAAGVGPDGRNWAWTGDDNTRLVRLDDESYYFDDIAGVQEQIALQLVPGFIDLGDRKGLIHQARIEWSGTDPVVEVDPVYGGQILNTAVSGNVELRVYRQWTMSTGTQQLQDERRVPLSPKQALGQRDAIDAWKAYTLKTVGSNALPSNTLGLQMDFIPATGTKLQRPIWIGGVELDVVVTDLPERRF